MSSNRKILITGATGKQGGAVLRSLLNFNPSTSNISLHALTRNTTSPSALALASKGVTLVKGSFSDPSSLVKALQGIDSAFLFTNIGKDEAKDGIAFVDAAKKAGVKFVVLTSVDGAERKSGVPHFDDKYEVEEHLVQSGLEHTILRPVAFMDNFPKQAGFATAMVFGIFDAALRSSGKPVQLVSVRDIGRVGAEALLHPKQYIGREIPLAGDELTIPQVIETYNRVKGAGYWKVWLPSFFISLLPKDVKLMFRWFGTHGYTVEIPRLRAEFPETLTLEQWLQLPEDEQ